MYQSSYNYYLHCSSCHFYVLPSLEICSRKVLLVTQFLVYFIWFYFCKISLLFSPGKSLWSLSLLHLCFSQSVRQSLSARANLLHALITFNCKNLSVKESKDDYHCRSCLLLFPVIYLFFSFPLRVSYESTDPLVCQLCISACFKKKGE